MGRLAVEPTKATCEVITREAGRGRERVEILRVPIVLVHQTSGTFEALHQLFLVAHIVMDGGIELDQQVGPLERRLRLRHRLDEHHLSRVPSVHRVGNPPQGRRFRTLLGGTTRCPVCVSAALGFESLQCREMNGSCRKETFLFSCGEGGILLGSDWRPPCASLGVEVAVSGVEGPCCRRGTSLQLVAQRAATQGRRFRTLPEGTTRCPVCVSAALGFESLQCREMNGSCRKETFLFSCGEGGIRTLGRLPYT